MRLCCLCKKKEVSGNGSFFKIPSDEQRRNKWSKVCQMELSTNHRICMDHFISSDLIKTGRKHMLMPNAVPFVQTLSINQVPDNAVTISSTMAHTFNNFGTFNEYECIVIRKQPCPTVTDIIQKQNREKETELEKPTNSFCALGCQYPKHLYRFPVRGYDDSRRNRWLEFFEMEEPNIDEVFACERHFSHKQTTEKGIRMNAVPDIPVLFTSITPPFKRKLRRSRTTTAVITRDSEETIYENSKGVFGENLFNINNNIPSTPLQLKPVVQMSFIKPESKAASTQTNLRLCGTVQVSDFADEYRFNCFYCCETFPVEMWKKFIRHLKRKHFDYEEAFQIPEYVSNDHDYTPIGVPSSIKIESDSTIQTPQFETLVINSESLLPHLVETVESTYTYPLSLDSFNPLEENMPVTFGIESQFNDPPNKINNMINDEPSTFTLPKEISIIRKNKPLKKKTMKQSTKKQSKNTQKSNQKVISSGVLYLKNKNLQTSNKTALSRCLKRSNTVETLDADEGKISTTESCLQKPTELSFEYTPRDIIDFLLDNMKNYPVLWEFDEQPFNEDYYEAIEGLCQIINDKWSLNIDTLKLRRSVNRVLSFYCSLYPCDNVENINQFANYYDKCAEFLPASVHDIAYARCSHCYRCYQNNSELRSHLLEEHKYLQWPYKCVQCKECFRDSDEFEFHKRLPHYEEVFRCKQCNRRYIHRNKYNKHVSTHQIKQNGEPGKHVCNVCGKVFKLHSELHAHKFYHGEKKYHCHLCPKSYFTNRTLRFHLKSHNKEYDLICEVCGKGFIHHNNLRQHMNKHTGAKVTCNICNLKLRKSSLMRHLRLVHVACEGTLETTHRARNYHYRSLLVPNRRGLRNKYKKDKNYSCKICKIRFEKYKLVVEHNKEFHSDIPKWSCKLCSAEFKHKLTLKRHYRFKHDLHIYQTFKLVEHNEDLDTVLAIKTEDLDKLCETEAYSSSGPSKVKKPRIHTTIVKSDPSAEEISIEEERLHSDAIQDEIMKVVDNIDVTTPEIKIDDDFFTNLLK